MISGKDSLPLIEGGKGISISNGLSSGAWAKSGGVGTFSGVNADSFDDHGNLIEQKYYGKTRSERHHELINFAIEGAVTQARQARDIAGKDAVLLSNEYFMGNGSCRNNFNTNIRKSI